MKLRVDGQPFSNEVRRAMFEIDEYGVESLAGDVLYIKDGKLEQLLRQFSPRKTIEACAALLTVPSFQAATPRLECLVHLALAHCAGKRKPVESDLARWVNRNLVDTAAWRLEDPAEDVFIGNICTDQGNFRILQDTYPYNEVNAMPAFILIVKAIKRWKAYALDFIMMKFHI